MIRRKDNKGRVLKDGETQGKDGRYRYQYIDSFGERKSVYSWKLLPTDRIAAGKRKDLSLREKEKEIMLKISKGLVTDAGKMTMTVIELVEKFIFQKKGVRYNTKANYSFVVNVIKKEDFAKKRIDKVKLSDAKAWLIKLQEDGRGYSTIHSVCGVVRPAFQMAVDDDLLFKNPFDFKMKEIVINDSVARDVITIEQEKCFLEFVKNSSRYSKYHDGIYILFNTGLRISEFVGLTISDIDFENKKIVVDHQLHRKNNMEKFIEEVKTDSGKRQIPMTDNVVECFKRIIENRKKPKLEPTIDGKTGFLFLDKNENPTVSLHWQNYFRHINKEYDKINKNNMPKITPHVCRHTFCSKMANAGMNPKSLQYIMGHKDISITLNVYAHTSFENAKEEMEKIKEVL